jgi:hypothetical protein
MCERVGGSKHVWVCHLETPPLLPCMSTRHSVQTPKGPPPVTQPQAPDPNPHIDLCSYLLVCTCLCVYVPVCLHPVSPDEIKSIVEPWRDANAMLSYFVTIKGETRLCCDDRCVTGKENARASLEMWCGVFFFFGCGERGVVCRWRRTEPCNGCCPSTAPPARRGGLHVEGVMARGPVSAPRLMRSAVVGTVAFRLPHLPHVKSYPASPAPQVVNSSPARQK